MFTAVVPRRTVWVPAGRDCGASNDVYHGALFPQEAQFIMKSKIDYSGRGLCCRKMVFFLDEGKVQIRYLPRFREHGIRLRSGAIQLICFCPWCGRRLPKSLRERYCDLLNQMGIEDIFYLRKIPSEFKSDEWWRIGLRTPSVQRMKSCKRRSNLPLQAKSSLRGNNKGTGIGTIPPRKGRP